MIRDALIQDVPSMLDRAEASHAKSVHRNVPFVRQDCEAVFSALIRDASGVVLTDGLGGFFAGAMTPFHFNASRMRLLEIGFDGLPLAALLDELTTRTPPQTEIIFAQERGPRARALGRLYRMNGLKPSTLAWAKEA